MHPDELWWFIESKIKKAEKDDEPDYDYLYNLAKKARADDERRSG